MKEPTVAVPVTLFLELVRVYKQEPQELIFRSAWLAAHELEKRATRKLAHYRKALCHGK